MSSSPPGTPPIVKQGPRRGPGPNVPANPVPGSPQATNPMPTGSPPVEQIDHTVAGLKPRIQHQSGAADGTPEVSIADINPPLAATLVNPPGGVGSTDFGEGASGITPLLTLPDLSDLPSPITLPPTSAIAGTPPWLDPAKQYVTPFTRSDTDGC